MHCQVLQKTETFPFPFLKRRKTTECRLRKRIYKMSVIFFRIFEMVPGYQ